jgi:hypothetical protein
MGRSSQKAIFCVSRTPTIDTLSVGVSRTIPAGVKSSPSRPHLPAFGWYVHLACIAFLFLEISLISLLWVLTREGYQDSTESKWALPGHIELALGSRSVCSQSQNKARVQRLSLREFPECW